MLEILFAILMIVVFGKILWLAFRMTWGITKILFSIVLLPLILIVLVIVGLVKIAIPVLAIIGIISLFSKSSE